MIQTEHSNTIRFVDLFAGLGGFHHGLQLATQLAGDSLAFECVLASEIDDELRRLYPINFPGLDEAYRRYHPPQETRALVESLKPEDSDFADALSVYGDGEVLQRIHGDLHGLVDGGNESLRLRPTGDPIIPPHDLLCAGFPCQPFSKSGAQLGFEDIRGTLFHLIAIILGEHQPDLVLLENVGNFARHDSGNTCRRVRTTLEELGYEIVATEHVGRGGGQGLLSPHHIGLPHHRERFFMVGQLVSSKRLPPLRDRYPFPSSHRSSTRPRLRRLELDKSASEALLSIIAKGGQEKSIDDLEWARLSSDKVRCIDHWNALLHRLAALDEQAGNRDWRDSMPAFPIWGYELDPWHWYPISSNPRDLAGRPRDLAVAHEGSLSTARALIGQRTKGRVDLFEYPPGEERSFLDRRPLAKDAAQRWVESWPQYAGRRSNWPKWKQRFLHQNRDWTIDLWSSLNPQWFRSWLDGLATQVPAASNQKLEWNCKGEVLDLYSHILQFRPSGLRVKRLRHVPSLVAMTTTQVPVIPVRDPSEPGPSPSEPQSRHLIPSEGLQLQGFPADWKRPNSRENVFQALGNAVHAGVVAAIVREWLYQEAVPIDAVRAQREFFAGLPSAAES